MSIQLLKSIKVAMLLKIFRKFSTSRPVYEAFLSSNYKSKKLWDERYDCPLLGGDEEQIEAINKKIITGNDLNSLELDIFINIAVPREEETIQLEESVKLLRRFRRSFYAHTQMPSTPHAISRLFLESRRLRSLVNLLDNRVDFGIFPDFFANNLALDEAIDKEMYSIAAKLASLTMLQEEFGVNAITDRLSLYGLSKYIESRTDFKDWPNSEISKDPILSSVLEQTDLNDQAQDKTMKKKEEKEEQGDEEEEEEDDAQYIRIPFLRNPYNDRHFDLTNPRLICGKTFKALGETFSMVNNDLATSVQLMGSILLGEWKQSVQLLDKLSSGKTEPSQIIDTAVHYVENLHEVEGPNDEEKSKILETSNKMTKGQQLSLSDLVKSSYLQLGEYEKEDIDKLRLSFKQWSEARLAFKRRDQEKRARAYLIEQIKAKKEEIRTKEQYLYYYDNLHKSKLTRITYD